MARATRVDFPGAWYHVLNRGTERRAIFRSTLCYEKFIQLLSSLTERFGVRLHGYALMGNHYHLQLESREANLSKALHWLNVSYSVWFNRKYSRVDPCFRDVSKPRTGRRKLSTLSSSVARNLWLRCASFSGATEINRQESGEERLKH
jgi:REP element-mobilizing transposase RayT